MSSDGKYIYGIVGESQPRKFSLRGVGDAEVYAINCRDLAAVVSDIGVTEVDPTRKNVLAHTIVQDGLLKEYSLIPMGFGMIAGSREEIAGLLERNYAAVVRELARLSGKVEVELKVFWDQDAMTRELQGKSDELTRLKARISSARSPVEAQSLLIEAGKVIERVVMDWRANYAERVYGILKGQALDARLNNLLGIKNILNASFLVDRSREGDFQKEVYRLDAQYQGKVNFKYVAPLPPYSFIDLRLEPAA